MMKRLMLGMLIVAMAGFGLPGSASADLTGDTDLVENVAFEPGEEDPAFIEVNHLAILEDSLGASGDDDDVPPPDTAADSSILPVDEDDFSEIIDEATEETINEAIEEAVDEAEDYASEIVSLAEDLATGGGRLPAIWLEVMIWLVPVLVGGFLAVVAVSLPSREIDSYLARNVRLGVMVAVFAVLLSWALVLFAGYLGTLGA